MVEPTRLRHRITRIIAATRFPFVDQETWTDDHITIDYDGIRGYRIENQTLRTLPYRTLNDEYDDVVT